MDQWNRSDTNKKNIIDFLFFIREREREKTRKSESEERRGLKIGQDENQKEEEEKYREGSFSTELSSHLENSWAREDWFLFFFSFANNNIKTLLLCFLFCFFFLLEKNDDTELMADLSRDAIPYTAPPLTVLTFFSLLSLSSLFF